MLSEAKQSVRELDKSVVTLVHGRHTASISPAVGGFITRFATDVGSCVHEWLRPMTDEALEEWDFLRSASYPMVPWCNRIAGGVGTFEGRTVAAEPDLGFEHPLHGIGRKVSWSIVDQADDSLTIDFRRPAGPWPWAFQALQRFDLDEDGLHVTLTLSNQDTVRMPGGIGHHPYFQIDGEVMLRASVDQRWLADDELLPTTLAQDPLAEEMQRGLPLSSLELDAVFTGWDGRASLFWPRRRATLELTANSTFGFLHLFRPEGGAFACVEPVSNITNWINIQGAPAGSIGGHVIEPGESLVGTFRMSPTFHDSAES